MNSEALKRKLKAHDFLKSLERELTSKTPPPTEMRKVIREIVTAAKHDSTRKHMRQPEDAALYHYAFPIIFDHMQTVDGIGRPQAVQALLSEFYRNMPDCCSHTPARTERHPFTKIVGASPAAIMAQWTGKSGAALRQACPDFAFREPFPYKVVFEGKYFEKGGAARAQTELATNIYQAFFYRGLPYVPPKKKLSPAWDYEFACLLAYDASEAGSLTRAWNSLDTKVKTGFWDGGDVYVMILRGPNAISDSGGE